MTAPDLTLRPTLRAELARRDLTTKDLAEHLGLSSVAIHRRLTGAVSWNLVELQAVSELFGVELVDLLATATATTVAS